MNGFQESKNASTIKVKEQVTSQSFPSYYYITKDLTSLPHTYKPAFTFILVLGS